VDPTSFSSLEEVAPHVDEPDDELPHFDVVGSASVLASVEDALQPDWLDSASVLAPPDLAVVSVSESVFMP